MKKEKIKKASALALAFILASSTSFITSCSSDNKSNETADKQETQKNNINDGVTTDNKDSENNVENDNTIDNDMNSEIVEEDIVYTEADIARGYALSEDTETLVIINDSAMNNKEWSKFDYIVKNVIIEDGVTRIEPRAFKGFVHIKSIMISDGVQEICAEAFKGCMNLTSVTIPQSVKKINGYAFAGCSSLVSVVLPAGVTTIGDYAFFECKNLTSIVIPDSVVEIGWRAFEKCTSLVSIEIPKNVTSISPFIFDGCTSLESVVIYENVTEIGQEAFRNCSNLSTIKFHGTKEQWTAINKMMLWDINTPAFTIEFAVGDDTEPNENDIIYSEEDITKGYILSDGILLILNDTAMKDYGIYSNYSPWYDVRKQIKKIVIKDGVTKIGNNAFYQCERVEEVIISDSVMSIGVSAFCNCENITKILIPDSVTNISDDAFRSCGYLKEVIMPSSVTNIGEGVFYNCDFLNKIDFRGTEIQWESIEKDSKWNQNMPKSTVIKFSL